MRSSKSARKRTKPLTSSKQSTGLKTKGKLLTTSPNTRARTVSAKPLSPKRFRELTRALQPWIAERESHTKTQENSSKIFEPYTARPAETVKKKLAKFTQKSQHREDILKNKIDQICANPHHNYHRLHGTDHEQFHVHINSHFVLIFRIIHKDKTVELLDFGHHDEVY